MVRDFVLELVVAPGSGTTITLPGVAPTGRLTWAAGFVTSQTVFYYLDDSTMQEWGIGQLSVGPPSSIARPTVVLGNSAGTTARLNFTDTCRCYSSFPAKSLLSEIENNTGRNWIQNGQFSVAQRGVGPFTTTGSYTADRWQVGISLDTASISIVAISDADRLVIGDEHATTALQNVFTGNAGASAYHYIVQKLESLRRLAGKTLTLSFWAKSGSGTPKIGVQLVQYFGTGGSPSASVSITGQSVTIAGSWARYSMTFAVPALTGKTMGSNADASLQIQIYYSAGATTSVLVGNIGVQSGTVSLYGVQIEVGPVMTGFEKRDLAYDLLLCQRFFVAGTLAGQYYAAAGATSVFVTNLPAVMRAAPTVALSGVTATNCSQTSNAWGNQGIAVNMTTTALGTSLVSASFTAAADL